MSGSLHLGTVFGYVQFDSVARFWRMRGKEVFFPVGWDDNGLPDRSAASRTSTGCAATLRSPTTRTSQSSQTPRRERPLSRRNFIELCQAG